MGAEATSHLHAKLCEWNLRRCNYTDINQLHDLITLNTAESDHADPQAFLCKLYDVLACDQVDSITSLGLLISTSLKMAVE